MLLDAEQIHSVIFQKELFLNFFFKLLHCEEKVKAKKCNRNIFFLLYKSMTPKKSIFRKNKIIYLVYVLPVLIILIHTGLYF